MADEKPLVPAVTAMCGGLFVLAAFIYSERTHSCTPLCPQHTTLLAIICGLRKVASAIEKIDLFRKS
jgi:hypothetical protein